MTGVNSEGGAGVWGVFLTNRDDIESLDHYHMKIHTTINVQTTNKRNKRKNKLKERENHQA